MLSNNCLSNCMGDTYLSYVFSYSSSSDIPLLGQCSSRCFRYSYKFMPYAFAISTMVRYKALTPLSQACPKTASFFMCLRALEKMGVCKLHSHSQASAVLYNIVETAKANDLKAYDYLEYSIDELAKHAEDTGCEFIQDFLPWPQSVQENARYYSVKSIRLNVVSYLSLISACFFNCL